MDKLIQELLVTTRIEQDISKEDIAIYLNISVTEYSLLEQEGSNMKLSTFKNICEYLSLDMKKSVEFVFNTK